MMDFVCFRLSRMNIPLSGEKEKPSKTQRFQGLMVVATGLDPVTPIDVLYPCG